MNLKKDFELFKENIYINLDINTEAIWHEEHKTRDKIENVHYYVPIYATSKEMFINPNGKFKGFRIQSTTWDITPEDWGGSTRDKFNILWNGKGLLKQREEFVVELERYK